MNEIKLFFGLEGQMFFLVKICFVLLLSFLLSYKAIPVIIRISKSKNLMDIPGDRSSHEYKIPNLGGIALFYTIGICAPIFAYELFVQYRFLFPALVILLYIGVMDDILVMKAYKKLIGQIVIATMMVVGSDVRIRSLFGLFGIYELEYFVSVFFSIFSFIILINAFNLIDGIDGLAGIFAVISFSIFGFSYYRLGEYNYPMVILCVVIIGSLLGFLYYNLSNNWRQKIFMGDTGSMIIGFILVFTAFYFIDLFISGGDTVPIGRPKYHMETAPIIAAAILIIPIIDTLNVIIVRLLNKKSPLRADRNHIHHKVLDLGFTHKKATAFIITYYMGIVLVIYFLRHIDINLLFLVVLSLGFFGAYLPNIISKMKK